MKSLGVVCVVVACGVVGASLAESLRRRVSTLGSLYSLLNDFSVSLRYTAPTVWQLVEDANRNPEYDSLRFLKAFQRDYSQGVAFGTLWNESVRGDASLGESEKGILYGVGNSLGRVGCEECVLSLRLAMDRVSLLRTHAAEEYSKKGNLYRWAGVLVGVAITIMVV